MPPRKLPPAVLAALGLSACVDGCSPEDLPLVGRLFDDDAGDDDAVGPCLEMMPCLSPVEDTDRPTPCLRVGPCLKVAPARPVTQPIRVGPCLKIARPPSLIPEEMVQPCLSDVAEPFPVPDPPEPQDQGGAIVTPRTDVVASLMEAGVLAPDVVDRLK